MSVIGELARRRWAEAQEAVRATNFEAFADLGSEANRRLTLLLVGSLGTAAGTIGTLALLPYSSRLGTPVSVTLAIGLAITTLGLVAIALPARIPMLSLDVIVLGVVAVLSIGISQSPGRVAGDTVLLFLWVAIGAVMLRSERTSLVLFALIAIASGALFAIDDTLPAPAFWWLLVVLGLMTIRQTVGWLVGRARHLAVRQRQARDRAERTSKELEKVSEQKSRFLAAMSHELRTPLNAVIGFAEMLRRRVAGPLNDHQSEYVDDMVDSGRHLLSLIDDTLDEAKVEAGHYALEPTDTPVSELIGDAGRLVRERAARAGITLEIEANDVGTVTLDERKVKQVLVNLLSNAVKFTPRGGRVVVTAVERNDVVEFSVADTGPGIDPAHHDSIFDEYHQTARPETSEGTGLGLSVARSFVELHGGHIEVESAVGHGARFTFTIPRRAAAPGGPSDPATTSRTESTGARDSEELVPIRELVHRIGNFAGTVGLGCAVGFFFVDEPDVSTTYFAVGAVMGIGAWFTGRWALRFATDHGLARLLAWALAGSTIATAFGFYHLGPLAPTAAAVWIGEAFAVQMLGMHVRWVRTSIHLSVVSIAAAVVLALQPGNEAPVAQWLAVVSTVWVGSFLFHWLVQRFRMLAEAEREAADDAVRAAADLEDVSRHKSRFLAGMSHELRTPLNAVIGFAEVLQREIPGPLNERQHQYVADIADSGRHLLNLINDVLDLAKIDAGRLHVTPAPVDVAGLVTNVAQRFTEDARDKQVTLAIDVDDGLTVDADAQRLDQALAGVVSNAVKFTPPGGTVALVSHQHGGTAVITVTDTGPGIDPAHHETIFEEFQRSDGTSERSADGVGLGLTLARRLVELHGGSLTVDSAPGAGATFTISLPDGAPPDGLESATQLAEKPA